MMRRVTAIVLFTLTAAPAAFACSCNRAKQTMPACQAFFEPELDVIFLGTPIGKAGADGLYRFAVLEAFKGLPRGVQQVFVDPSQACPASFAQRDYLVFATKSPEHRIPVYISSACHPTRPVGANQADLVYLRQRQATRGQSWIFGRALQNFPTGGDDDPAQFQPLPGATVTARATSGGSFTAVADAEGAYRLDLPAGTYSITAGKPGFKSYGPVDSGSVAPGGCANINPGLHTANALSGQVLRADGRPHPGVTVWAAAIGAEGELMVLERSWSETDQRGRFRLATLPAGRIVIGINLRKARKKDDPFALYAPGVRDVRQARVFTLGPESTLEEATIRMPGR